MLVVLLQKGCMMQDILIRLQNQPKINEAHPKDIEDAIKEIKQLRDQVSTLEWNLERTKEHLDVFIPQF